MTALTKAAILAAIATTPILKEINGFGEVYLKKLTVAEQGELAKQGEKTDNVTASLYKVAYSLCDENGKRLFNDNDVKELGNLTAEQMTAIVGAISEINGFDAKLDDIKKN
ncbi:phage tail assembly chaperone family protein, TAC [Moraxella sp. ZY200743]|uniref:phage tail assembly chaperone family protein, TAC n=1 Tax=Moraxella sp. ZY200743 TaxID=2911970 RepID=UPI003D7EB82E